MQGASIAADSESAPPRAAAKRGRPARSARTEGGGSVMPPAAGAEGPREAAQGGAGPVDDPNPAGFPDPEAPADNPGPADGAEAEQPPAKKRRGRPPGKKAAQSAPATPAFSENTETAENGGNARGRGRGRPRGRGRGRSSPAAHRRHSPHVWAPPPSEIGSIAHRVAREHRRRQSAEPDGAEHQG